MGDTRDHPVESLLQETPRGEGGASRRSRLDPPWMAGKMNSENPSVPLNPLAEFNQISSWFSSRGPGPGGCVGYVWGGPSWGSPGSSMTVGVERKTLGEAPEWGASSFRRAPRVRLASCLSLRGERCLLTEAPLGLLLYSDRVPRDAPHLHPHQVPHFSRRAAAPGAPSAVQPIRDTPVPALPVALPLPRAAFPCLLRLGWAGLGWAGRTCSWAGGARLPPQVTAHPSQLLALTHSGHGGSEEQLSISEDFRDWPEKKLPQLMTSSSRVVSLPQPLRPKSFTHSPQFPGTLSGTPSCQSQMTNPLASCCSHRFRASFLPPLGMAGGLAHSPAQDSPAGPGSAGHLCRSHSVPPVQQLPGWMVPLCSWPFPVGSELWETQGAQVPLCHSKHCFKCY
nr:uncharacterized protein LOC127492053 isoform X1 [Oryctolagus cuniculus]